MRTFLNRKGLFAVVAASAAILAAGVAASASAGHLHLGGEHASPSITSQPWGTADGQPVNLYTLDNGRGMTVTITNYGGVVQSINVPDRNGNVANVALGFPNLAGYVADNTTTTASGETFFGAIIGRYANRIANGSFSLNGTTYTLDSEQWHEHTPRRRTRFAVEYQGLGGDADQRVARRQLGADLHRPRRLRRQHAAPLEHQRLPGDRHREGRVHADAGRRAPDQLHGDDRRADGHQPHQPHVFQPRR